MVCHGYDPQKQIVGRPRMINLSTLIIFTK